MGWFDGNPAHLWEHPPVESSKRYLECMGGAAEAVAKARGYVDGGDLRFAAQLLNHVVFAEPANTEAKDLLAQTYERLGFGAECGTWRNFYLTGAGELRQGVSGGATQVSSAGLARALTVEQMFDSIAIQINGPAAWAEHLTIDWHLTDLDEHYRMTLSNGALIHYPDPSGSPADLSLTLTRAQLLGLLAGQGTGGISTEGDMGVLERLLGFLDPPEQGFPIVTP
jgi:alkyl sulfatase BDS1-like metallo-beta-lactamase superfamily hydrolase